MFNYILKLFNYFTLEIILILSFFKLIINSIKSIISFFLDKIEAQGNDECKNCFLEGKDCQKTSFKFEDWLKYDTFKCVDKPEVEPSKRNYDDPNDFEEQTFTEVEEEKC